MKLAIAIGAFIAYFAGESLATHSLKRFIVPSISVGSTSYDAQDNSLLYKKSIDAAESGNEYANSYYDSVPSYGYPGGYPGGFPGGFPGGYPGGFPGGYPGGYPGDYYSGDYYNYPPTGNCGINCGGPSLPLPLSINQPSVNYGSSSGSEYNKDLRYRKSLDQESNGESYQNNYYNNNNDNPLY